MPFPFRRKPAAKITIPATPKPIDVGAVMLEEHSFVVHAIATYAAMASQEHPDAEATLTARPIVFLDVEGRWQQSPESGIHAMRLLLPADGVEALRESLGNCLRILDNVQRSQDGEA